MSYATTARRPNPAAMLGAFGVPAGVGAVLIAGLAVQQVIAPPIPNPTGVPVPEVIEITPEPVEPETGATTTSSNSSVTEPTLTRPPSEFDFELGSTEPIGTLSGAGEDLTGGIGPVDFGPPLPSPTPIFDPVSASPQGNPGHWITDSDYQTSWIRRGYSGTAGFMLEIDSQGRVSDCTITRSTGHTALDDATCRLISQRAQFNPAMGTSGTPVAGTYASAVQWRIPE